jgi:hypothetical protein
MGTSSFFYFSLPFSRNNVLPLHVRNETYTEDISVVAGVHSVGVVSEHMVPAARPPGVAKHQLPG